MSCRSIRGRLLSSGSYRRPFSCSSICWCVLIAVCFVYTCRRLIDLSLSDGCLLCIYMPAIDRSLSDCRRPLTSGRMAYLGWYLLRGICIHNKSHNLPLILGLNYAYIFPGVGIRGLPRPGAITDAAVHEPLTSLLSGDHPACWFRRHDPDLGADAL